MITRNPGVTCVWVSTGATVFPDGLFEIGEPRKVRWYAQGRPATRAEVEASIDSGMPELEKLCSTQEDRDVLAKLRVIAERHWPDFPVGDSSANTVGIEPDQEEAR